MATHQEAETGASSTNGYRQPKPTEVQLRHSRISAGALLGSDKVLLFVRSIDQAEREAIRIELEEDNGANGLTED